MHYVVLRRYVTIDAVDRCSIDTIDACCMADDVMLEAEREARARARAKR